jgi:hypothetical protein
VFLIILLSTKKNVNFFNSIVANDVHVTRGDFDENTSYPETKVIISLNIWIVILDDTARHVSFFVICLPDVGFRRNVSRLRVCFRCRSTITNIDLCFRFTQ